MKELVLLFCLLGFWGTLKAREETDSLTCVITGKVIGGEDEQPLPGAHIFLGSGKILVAVSDSIGKFEISKLPSGEHWLRVSYIGFRPWERKITLKERLDVGEIVLTPLILDEVVVSARPPLTVQRGDSVQFNPAALHLAEDADLENLLKKLPGFRIVDGKIMAQGQEVKKIYIDGMEYAINDPAAALKNLPAKLIARIKMFDERSEEAEFSGYDDGSKFRTLNIETKNPNRMKVFGFGEAAYGLQDLADKSYRTSLSLNMFDRKQRITLSGNATRLGLNDLPDARYKSEGNKNKTTNFFGNYSSKISEKLQVSGNYRWNKNTSNSASLSRQEYLPTEHYESRIYDRESHSNATQDNQGANVSIDYRITEKNRIRFTPNFNVTKGHRRSLSWNSSIENGDTLNRTEMRQIGRNDSKRLGGHLSWMHAFGKAGRTFTLQVQGMYDEDNSADDREIGERIAGRDANDDSVRFQRNDDERMHYSVRVEASYSEPLTKYARLSFNFHLLKDEDQSDRQGLTFHDPEFEVPIGIDTALTNKSVNEQFSQNIGINYNYHKEKLTLNGGGSLRWMQMKNRNQFIGKADSVVTSNYLDVSPRAEFIYRMSEKAYLTVNYNGNTASPSAVQLQDILNVSDPLQVSRGNPGLKKSYSHNLSMRYSASDPLTSRFFWANMDIRQTIRQISTNVKFIDKDTLIDGYLIAKGGTLTTPVNLNGMWGVDAHANYAFPVRKIRLDLSGSYGYSHQPSIYDNRQNMTQMHRGEIGVGLHTDFSDNFDFFVQSSTSYSYSRNSSTGRAHNLNQTVMAHFRWLIWKNFLIGGDYYYSYFWNKTGSVTVQSNNSLNLEVGKKFGKKKQAELTLRINDVFRDRDQVQYSVTDLYTQMNCSTGLQDYYMLSFTYRFNRMGKE